MRWLADFRLRQLSWHSAPPSCVEELSICGELILKLYDEGAHGCVAEHHLVPPFAFQILIDLSFHYL